jgi:hypothetical protein
LENDNRFRNKLAIAHHEPEIQNVILGIVGRKGTGKSTVTREILKRGDREFIFDTAADHSWVPDTFTSLDEAITFIFDVGNQGGSFIARYVPEGEDEDDQLVRDVSEISKAIWEVGNVTYSVEELPMFSQPQWQPPKLNRLFRMGRHHAINLVYTGQRAAELPRRATGATDVFIFFHTSEPADLDRIQERCGSECADLVRNLGEHEFVVFDVRRKSLIEIDSRWYDLVLTPTSTYTPAIGGRNGRKALWSLHDAE